MVSYGEEIMNCIEHDFRDFIKDFHTLICLYPIFGLSEQRARVGSRGEIIFEIRTKEQGHNVPHIHAYYGSLNISISLIDFRVLAGNIPQKQQKLAIDWVCENFQVLRTKWNQYHKYKIIVI